MGNKTGGAQPGIVKSDEYPWGLKDIIMPIPIEFARKLRNDPATQKAYREFVYDKTYQLVVKFIQYERDLVYKKFYSEEIPDIDLVKLNMDTVHLNIPRMINPYDNDREKISPFSVHGGMFYFPNLLNTAPVEIRQKIGAYYNDIRRNGHTCMFTDDPLLHAIVLTEKDQTYPYHEDNEQIDAFTFSDMVGGNTDFNPSKDASRAIMRVVTAYRVGLEIKSKNQKILKNILSNTRQLVSVGWTSVYGTHDTSVIMDTTDDIGKFYVLDSNGVDNCAEGIFNYFADVMGWHISGFDIIPIMPFKPDETPRAFQTISRGGFCQTWNIFSQQLIIKNKFKDDINKFVYDEVLNYAEPIISAKVSDDARLVQNINISLILLEFMFYIYYELARDEIIKWIKRAESKDDYLDYYMPPHPKGQEAYDVFILHYLKNIPNLELNEFLNNDIYEPYRQEAWNLTRKFLLTEWEKILHGLRTYNFNPDATEYLNLKLRPEEPIVDMDIFLSDEINKGL